MRSVSNDFLTAVRNENRQVSSSLAFQTGEIVADELESYKIETVALPFNVSMKKITAKIFSTEIDFLNKIITPKFAVNNHQISLEPFEITEVKINLENGTAEISGFDAMLKTHKIYQKTSHNYPCSMSEFISQIATACELELAENFEIPNSNLEIPIDYFEKIHQISYRDILRQIAEISGGIFLARNGKLAFSKLLGGKIRTTLTDFDLKKLTLSEKTKPINSLVLSRSPQEDNIYFRRANFDAENLSELKIANNEIIDKRRNETAEMIFGTIEGVSWQGFKAETFGFGFLEAGDKIRIRAGGSDFESFVFNSTLNVSQSLSENFETAVLTPTITNYKRASEIFRTISNTELVVDKQKQLIESVVSETREQAERTETEFSKLNQNINRFDFSLQKAGGLNLIKNSAFWSWNDSMPNFWTVLKTPEVQSSPEAKTNGSISARTIRIENNTISQAVSVVRGEKYSFSALIKKPVIGTLMVKIIQNNAITHTETIANGTEVFYQKLAIENIEATSGEIKIEINSNDVNGAILSDLMLANNDRSQNWTMAQGEIANSNIVIDEKGVLVKSSLNEGDYTIISPLEFSGYSKLGTSSQRVFSLNKDTTEVKKLKAEDELNMTPLKIVAIKDGDTTGWAIVSSAERSN